MQRLQLMSRNDIFLHVSGLNNTVIKTLYAFDLLVYKAFMPGTAVALLKVYILILWSPPC
ncbi:hypothetical protein PSYMP_01454 [Pseudomonas amygdali pv. morsprunorum str. M302280]|nr:hypothetical protein PSYMP_01454 [Pseudomonas amygdali pv. morsprunorum str. M302280]